MPLRPDSEDINEELEEDGNEKRDGTEFKKKEEEVNQQQNATLNGWHLYMHEQLVSSTGTSYPCLIVLNAFTNLRETLFFVPLGIEIS